MVAILILAAALRYLYYLSAPGIYVSDDTYAYYQIGQKMFSGNFFADDFRTPVYPIVLTLPLYLTGMLLSPIFSAPFLRTMHQIIIFQSVLAVATLLILYLILKKLKLSPFSRLCFLLFISLNPIVFAWERLLLPESLTAFFLIALSLSALHILKKPSRIALFTFFLLSVFGFLLRPVYIFLPVPILLLIVFYHRFKKQIIFAAFLILAVYFSIIGIYVNANRMQFDYPGVSRASDINLLGKILTLNLPVESAKNESAVFEAVNQYREDNKELHPWRFLDTYAGTFYGNTSNLNSLSRFTKTVISHNLPTFVSLSTLALPASLLDISEKYILKEAGSDNLSFFFNLLFRFYHNLQYLTLIVFIAYPLSFYKFLKTRNFHNSSMLIIGTISLYQIIFSVFFSYAEFGRLISPSQPLLYLFSFYWWGKILNHLSNLTRKK